MIPRDTDARVAPTPIAATLAVAALLAAASICSAPLPTTALPDLPRALTNNAVAALERDDGVHLISLMGLRAGKTWRDTTLEAWHLPPQSAAWRALPDVPGNAGRLAGVAVGVAGLVYVFGGYTVSEDGSEVSIPSVHSLDIETGRYTERSPMPVPVDDTVALVYRDRFVYLVSGWHDLGNVNLVQLYDTLEDRWAQATPWPGTPLFGHAGGSVGSEIVICDGVGVEATRNKRRFVAVPACFRGTVDADEVRRIHWKTMPHHPGPALYRMAATGTRIDGSAAIVFAGGSPNPYNFDGIGYDGNASQASARVFSWNIDAGRWSRMGRLPAATMDHRGLLPRGDLLVIVGGMRQRQQVSPGVTGFVPR